MGHILKAGFTYLIVPETGQPRVHPRELPVGGSIGDKKWGVYSTRLSSGHLLPETKLINDTQGALRTGEGEGEGSLPQM